MAPVILFATCVSSNSHVGMRTAERLQEQPGNLRLDPAGDICLDQEHIRRNRTQYDIIRNSNTACTVQTKILC